jgi:hypothetical protein
VSPNSEKRFRPESDGRGNGNGGFSYG